PDDELRTAMANRWIVLVVIVGLTAWGFNERRMLNAYMIAWTEGGEIPALLPAQDEGVGVRWYDDYFTIQQIAPDTFAIGEPRYLQQTYSYLIIGRERALMFDGGPGIHNIKLVAQSLTDKPITFLPSHLHYDHVGNNITWAHVALPNLPSIRSRTEDGIFSPTDRQFLGFVEGWDEAPKWRVDEWVRHGEEIDLGGRVVTLYATPGHTRDSVSLYDARNGLLLSGDYLYPGSLYAFLPGSSVNDYLQTATELVAAIPPDTTIYGAHSDNEPGAPVLEFGDLADLEAALFLLEAKTLEGDGTYPQYFRVNERLGLLAEPRWLQDWD
ncbi:MAG: MBL fold metallo-hydrolase, partial [Pseudomonadota bacterium]